MTTPLSKMVALLVPSPLTPKRGQGSAGSLSEVKKGVAWSWHGRVAQICARGSMENNFLGANLGRQSGPECQGLKIPVKSSLGQ